MTEYASTMTSSMSALEQRVANAANWLIDLVFPPSCGNCGRADFRFCHDCQRLLANVPIEMSHRRVNNFDGICATGKHDAVLRNAVGAFKYEGATTLAALLAARLVSVLQRQAWSIDSVVPVPLFADRLIERGYNQSYLLSRSLSQDCGIPCNPECLVRLRNTGQQARQSSAEERQLNVQGAFAASDDVRGLSILLIDDVVSTGSTLSECAAALRAKGAYAIYGLAVCHA